MTTEHFDLVIVGAGFAGLSCAKEAAEFGLNVLVIDRKPEAGHAPHTTGIIVKEANEVFRVPEHLTRRVEGIRLYSPSLRSCDLTSPGYYFLTTDTKGYLAFMAKEAERAGVTIRFNVSYETAYQTPEHVVLPELNITCKYLIGADGARSKVAQTFGLSKNSQFLLGVEAEYRGIKNIDPDRLHCFLDSSLARGYIAWVAPGVDMIQVGLACNQKFKPDLKKFIQKISTLFDFSEAEVIGHRGGLIPVGGKLRNLAKDRVLLLGDSAGIVSPLTAGGIYPALYTGQYLAKAIHENLHLKGPQPATLLKDLYPDYRWKYLLRVMLDYAPPNPILEAVVASPPFRAVAQGVFFHHRGIFEPAAWRDILLSPALYGAK